MDDRRKRLLYRATHRGTKETDVIIGGFFTARAAGLTEAQVAEAEALLEENDLDLLDWLMGRQPVPERWHGTIFDELMARQDAQKTD
jgi:antitoxin CptB